MGLARIPRAIGDQGIILNVRDRFMQGLPHSHLLACGKHFPFLLSVDKVIVVLHANEFGPTILLCDMLKAAELVGIH